MHWEIVLAILKELSDWNVILILILKEFGHSDIVGRQELANGAIEELSDWDVVSIEVLWHYSVQELDYGNVVVAEEFCDCRIEVLEHS